MAPLADWKLEGFFWLKLEEWNPDRILSWYTVDGKKYCKVCDKFVVEADEKSHVKEHVRQAVVLKEKRKKEAAKHAKEMRALARREKGGA